MSIASEITRLSSAKAALKDAIVAKGVEVADSLKLDGYAEKVAAIPTGGEIVSVPKNDVNFYLPNGILIKSFAKDEFLLELNRLDVSSIKDIVSMPKLEGLTAQDWNWELSTWEGDDGTKAALIDQLNSSGCVDIGGLYVTDDGDTRIYITIPEDDNLYQSVSYACTGGTGSEVDWGDGTKDTYTHSIHTTVSHTYREKGDYIIRIHPSQGATITFGRYQTNIFGYTLESASFPGYLYWSRLKKLELGMNVKLGSEVFENLTNLESITIPKGVLITDSGNFCINCRSLSAIVLPHGVNKLGQSAFQDCTTLCIVVLPKSVTTIDSYAFRRCYSLQSVIFPQGLKTLSLSAFSSCKSLSSIIFPHGVGSIGQSCFESCSSIYSILIFNKTSLGGVSFSYLYGLRKFDFSRVTEIQPLPNINVFSQIGNNAKIIVPDILYDDWCAATNWSDPSILPHIWNESETRHGGN